MHKDLCKFTFSGVLIASRFSGASDHPFDVRSFLAQTTGQEKHINLRVWVLDFSQLGEDNAPAFLTGVSLEARARPLGFLHFLEINMKICILILSNTSTFVLTNKLFQYTMLQLKPSLTELTCDTSRVQSSRWLPAIASSFRTLLAIFISAI